MQNSPRPQSVQQRGQPDMFLSLLEGPVVAVAVGSGRQITRYNLPVALLCYHSHFFKQETLRYEAIKARLGSNKKRKIPTDSETTTVGVKKEDSESGAGPGITEELMHKKDEAAIRLPDIDPSIFGLFLKYVYTGFYPEVVDARPGTTRCVPHTTMSTQHDVPYNPAKAAMPPPANINFRSAPPGGHMPSLPAPTSNPSTAALTLQDSSDHPPIPPSVHAYLLSIHLGAPGFLNQALNRIYYGIGKYFALTPSLVHHIWTHTPPHPFCSWSPLRKLVLDVLVVHWSSTSTHIIAKHSVLNKLWNEAFDTHRDLRHEFTMGLQGSAKLLPVQAYFVSTTQPNVTVGQGAKKSEVDVAEIRSREVGTSAAGAIAVATEQDNGGGEGKE